MNNSFVITARWNGNVVAGSYFAEGCKLANLYRRISGKVDRVRVADGKNTFSRIAGFNQVADDW